MQGPGSEVYAVSANGVPVSRASIPQQEASRADPAGTDEPHSISPFKWWVDRDRGTVQSEGAHMWLAKPDTTEFHDDFWYDTEAILSRKSSVRFRRTVDLMLPVYNQQVCLFCVAQASVLLVVSRFCACSVDVYVLQHVPLKAGVIF